jgi:hypothetical protein
MGTAAGLPSGRNWRRDRPRQAAASPRLGLERRRHASDTSCQRAGAHPVTCGLGRRAPPSMHLVPCQAEQRTLTAQGMMPRAEAGRALSGNRFVAFPARRNLKRPFPLDPRRWARTGTIRERECPGPGQPVKGPFDPHGFSARELACASGLWGQPCGVAVRGRRVSCAAQRAGRSRLTHSHGQVAHDGPNVSRLQTSPTGPPGNTR